MYAEYKATRQKAPEDLHSQVPLVEEALRALGVPCLALDGYEADDIIATLAMKCREEGRQCYILSSDKDLLQLVDKRTWELRPMKAAGEGSSGGGLPYELVGSGEVKAEWGVNPDKVLDLLSLTGDSSDNVPGVKGVGEKTAVKLMSRYGSLDEIYKNIAGIEGSVGKKLAEGKESAYFSKDLIKLVYDVPLPVKDIDELSVENLDRTAGARVLLREGIRQSAKQLDPAIGGSGPAAAPTAEGAAPETAAAPPVAREHPSDESLLGEGKYKTILDMKELEALLGAAKKQKLLALDFETDSLDAWNASPIGISFAIKPKEAFYAPVAAHAGTAPFLDPDKVRGLLAPLLADPSMTIAAHNAKYDYKVSRGWGIERWKCKIWDTMVAAWLVDPERNNYSLDSLSAFLFGVSATAYKDIVPKGQTFDTVPLETACLYSAEDADLCLRVKQYLEPRLKDAESQGLFTNLEMPLLPILAEMEGVGIKIEPKVLRDYGVELGKELENIQGMT
jgi:DNA polymerase-1